MFEALVENLYNLGLVKMNLSAFVSNGLMTLTRYVPKKHPIDFNKKLPDGKPITGSHKTFEGLAINAMSSTTIGYALSPVFGEDYAFYSLYSSLISAGSDILGSFIKRRLGKPEGYDFPLIDRTVWLIAYPLLYQQMYKPDLYNFIAAYAITLVFGPIMHKLTNEVNLWGRISSFINKYRTKV